MAKDSKVSLVSPRRPIDASDLLREVIEARINTYPMGAVRAAQTHICTSTLMSL